MAMRPQSNPSRSVNSDAAKSAAAAMKSGQFSSALRLCEEVLAADPSSLEAAILASSAAMRLGKLDEAIAYATKVIHLDPKESTGYAILGRCYMASNRPLDAVEQFGAAITLDPNQPVILQLLGQALQQSNRFADAAEAYRRAVHLAPNLIEAHIALGQLYIRLGDRGAAGQCFRRAFRLEPTSGRGFIQLAKSLLEDAEYEKAEEALLKAESIDPQSPVPFVLLGQLYQQQGMFEKAGEANLRAIRLQPTAGKQYLQFVQSRRMTSADQEIMSLMSSAVEGGRLSDDDRWQLHFALGKAFDDLGQFEKAMAHFDEANRIMHTIAFPPFDRAAHRDEIEATIRSLPLESFEALRQYGSESEAPVFIVGMIRSGTTLVEQIVSSHPEVAAGGELKFWLENTRRILNSERSSIDPENLRQVSSEYLKQIDRLSGGRRRITDKMPLNFLFIGAMHLAFPNARFIHCRRSPLDNCISMFATPFPQPVNFLHSRENIVFYYKQYLRLIDHWRNVIPADRLLEVDYELLVSNPAPLTHRMIEFLGLDWDDACLHPEELHRAVRTPSTWQVRQPIYRSSVDRWRNYEPWLGAFREFLPVS